MHPERLVAFMLYQSQLQRVRGEPPGRVHEHVQERGGGDGVFELMDRAPSFAAGSARPPPTATTGEVTLSDVHFAYPSRVHRPVLRGLTLRADPGSSVALVGASGSGKSTVFHLLQHFYEPDLGTVALDGDDVSSLSPEYLHRAVAVVSQEPVLFSGSVSDNIGYSRRDASNRRDAFDLETTSDASSDDSDVEDTFAEYFGFGCEGVGGYARSPRDKDADPR